MTSYHVTRMTDKAHRVMLKIQQVKAAGNQEITAQLIALRMGYKASSPIIGELNYLESAGYIERIRHNFTRVEIKLLKPLELPERKTP